MAKFNAAAIMDSAKKIAQQVDELEPVPETKEIRCSFIDFNDNNIFAKHDTAETIAELAADIEANGLMHPIVVNHVGDRYVLISGERRFRAISVLHWKVVQANVYESLNKFGEMKRLCAANFQVRQYTAAEMLDHYQHLTRLLFAQSSEESLSAKQKDEVAELLNVTRRQVSKYARICKDLSQEERQAITENRMSINQADELARSRAQESRPTALPSRLEPVPEQPKKPSDSCNAKGNIKSTHPVPQAIREPVPSKEKESSPVTEKENFTNQEPVPMFLKQIHQTIDTITLNLSLLRDMLEQESIDASSIDQIIQKVQKYRDDIM